ncbi:hypothetical protein [Streptomyces sp. NPDC051561]|uniref:hypothetical protein n=1 Tax=Streptomyces sp. NPDC051561 TaxID=3365658 RepID=UPI00379AF2AD
MRNTLIPGVVDGTVTRSVDDEGHVSFHVLVPGAKGHPDSGDRIEIVLVGTDAEQLLSAHTSTPTVPCSVGVRFGSRSPLSTAR